MNDTNSMCFDSTNKSSMELLNKFLNMLFEYNSVSDDNYCDIHIKTEDKFIILEWVVIPYNHEWGGEFKYIDEEHLVVKEIRFPDNSCGYAFSDDDEEEKALWERFHDENPGWVKTPYGTWTNEIENAKWKEELENYAK